MVICYVPNTNLIKFSNSEDPLTDMIMYDCFVD